MSEAKEYARLVLLARNPYEPLLEQAWEAGFKAGCKRGEFEAQSKANKIRDLIRTAERALDKLYWYNIDIADRKINYRPVDHAEVALNALTEIRKGLE